VRPPPRAGGGPSRDRTSKKMNRLHALRSAGVSIWLDTLSRDLLDSGQFEALVRNHSVTGATSNPTIFAKAITGSRAYDSQLRGLLRGGVEDPKQLFFALALEDVTRAARLLRPVHQATTGRDGYVSFEVTPDLSYDAEATIEQALEVWGRPDQRNLMIKVPATGAGPAAIEELTSAGVNVNVTLLFSISRYEQVIEAYLRGLERRARAGLPLSSIASVASFFVSRVDGKVDPLLPGGSPLRGRVAIANAQRAYLRHLERFSGARWGRLDALGARPQLPLWASTGTKDPAYSDVHYVEPLAFPGVINTMPEATLRAFADHGLVGHDQRPDPAGVERVLADAAGAGIDLDRVTAELEAEGVGAFCESYRQLLGEIARRAAELKASHAILAYDS
jgi:transaldolase